MHYQQQVAAFLSHYVPNSSIHARFCRFSYLAQEPHNIMENIGGEMALALAFKAFSQQGLDVRNIKVPLQTKNSVQVQMCYMLLSGLGGLL